MGLNIEFIASRNTDRVIASLTENSDYFPLMSLIAYNLWWIVSGAKGLGTSDKRTVLGLLNAKTVGLILFSAAYFFAMVRQLWEKTKTDHAGYTQTFLESLILVNAAFFLFQTQSHDRYAYPLSVFLLLWAPFVVVDHNSGLVASRMKLWSVFMDYYGILLQIFIRRLWLITRSMGYRGSHCSPSRY